MTIALVIVTDGRGEYLEQTIASTSNLKGIDGTRLIVDDSGDETYAQWLQMFLYRVHSSTVRSGLATSVYRAWRASLEDSQVEFIFHLEDDFTFNEPIDLAAMADVLRAKPYLAQLSLKRQPVNDEERAAGGFVQRDLSLYTQKPGWIEHHGLFTFNPCLIPRAVAELCLADPRDGLERGFTDTLLAHGYTFGILGQIDDPPKVEHIGEHRSAAWHV